ncbi:MAG: FtsX-like permease family protein, partial [Terriglobales bacterium]
SGPVGPYLYLPLAQSYKTPAVLQIRAPGASFASLAQAVRSQVAVLDPAMPVLDVEPMTQALDSINGLGLYQLGAGMAAAMGFLGLIMAVIGVYGVVAYSASQRTQEFGLRLALGASRAQVLRMVLRQGLWLTVLGIGAGVLLASALAGGLASMLTGVGQFDPLTYVAAALLLGAIALLASLVPALRALHTDPSAALRCE